MLLLLVKKDLFKVEKWRIIHVLHINELLTTIVWMWFIVISKQNMIAFLNCGLIRNFSL